MLLQTSNERAHRDAVPPVQAIVRDSALLSNMMQVAQSFLSRASKCQLQQ